MKTEMYHQQAFANHLSARTAVMEYIESWYNRRRPHAYNGASAQQPRSLPTETAANRQQHRKTHQPVSKT